MLKLTPAAKRKSANRSLNAWRRRKAKGAVLVPVELSKQDVDKLLLVGRLQAWEQADKLELRKAVLDVFDEHLEILVCETRKRFE